MVSKWIRFTHEGKTGAVYGTLDGELVIPMNGAPWDSAGRAGQPISRAGVRLMPPVTPSKVVCIGLNYHAHVAASQSATVAPEYPLIFLKPPSSVIGPDDEIIHPNLSQRVDFEAEVGIVIGKATHRKLTREEVPDVIFGYTCVNDVTARDLQKKDGQWSRAKGFDTFCPVGPEIVAGLDWRDLAIEGRLNGKTRQRGRTSQMIFDIPRLITHIASIMTLNPGDLVSTGTPEGLCTMMPGDVVEVIVEGIAPLRNRVASAE